MTIVIVEVRSLSMKHQLEVKGEKKGKLAKSFCALQVRSQELMLMKEEKERRNHED